MSLDNAVATTPSFNDAAPKAPFDFIRLRTKTGDSVEIKFEDLTIKVPNGERTLIENANVTIRQGDRVSLTGPNGGGKSFLFRISRGLTSDGSGKATITIPDGSEIFFASQEIRKTPTTLPGLLAYRHAPEKYSHEQYEDAMKEAGLDEFLVHLPWNAMQPENILHLLKPILDEVLEPYAGVVTPHCAKDFMKVFRKRLEANLDMPSVLEDYYTDEIKHKVVDVLCAHAEERLKSDPTKEQILVLRTAHSAKKAANALIENAESRIDSWLLQGQRMVLSGGEQQRMVFARAFLQANEISLLLLDEPTSALKEDAAEDLLGKLFDKIPNAAAIAITHTPALMKFFTHHMKLGEDKSHTITSMDQTPANEHAVAAYEQPS